MEDNYCSVEGENFKGNSFVFSLMARVILPLFLILCKMLFILMKKLNVNDLYLFFIRMEYIKRRARLIVANASANSGRGLGIS